MQVPGRRGAVPATGLQRGLHLGTTSCPREMAFDNPSSCPLQRRQTRAEFERLCSNCEFQSLRYNRYISELKLCNWFGLGSITSMACSQNSNPSSSSVGRNASPPFFGNASSPTHSVVRFSNRLHSLYPPFSVHSSNIGHAALPQPRTPML